ncbi:MAG: hypothetical protein JWP88_377 [Flaviaesturariibacter sp.]|nr:hypothetical protein [Flaviaesturariibacter sp.]
MKRRLLLCLALLPVSILFAQTDSTRKAFHPDSSLRIINLNPFFTLHVDSTLTYPLQINKNPEQYFWFLKNSPVGLRINKDNGLLTFNANKALFLSGKLKYDVNYRVNLGVQNLSDPSERVDTSFTIIFYNTEIIPSRVKPTVQGTIWIDEGDSIAFKVVCETGSFPLETILTLSSSPINQYKDVQKCGDEFRWTPGYDMVKETDSGRVKLLQLYFIGANKFNNKDTATVRVIIRDALNYPLSKEQYGQVVKNVDRYVLQLKYTFLQLDKKLKRTKSTRTTFDLTSASTSLTGTVLSTSSDAQSQRTGKILPSVGLALVPIKEAAVPNRAVDQNQAALIRSSIKRLEYMLQDNLLVGERDPEIVRKTTKLKEELKQVQVQLLDVQVEFTNEVSEEQLNRYFNSPKVAKKYRLKSR